MTLRLLINGTNAAMNDVNLAGADVPAFTALEVDLTDVELGTFVALNGAAAMQTVPTAAEKNQIGDLLIDGSGVAPGTDYEIVNGSDSALANVNAAGDDLTVDPKPSGSANGPIATGVSLTPSEAWALLATANVYIAKKAANDAANYKARRRASRILKYRKPTAL